jgi:hypothetical protein
MPLNLHNELVDTAGQVRTLLARQREAATGKFSANASSPQANAARKNGKPGDLPDWFAAHDRNSDGQIALSEWERDRLSEFRHWDRNGDGFITAVEVRSTLRTPPAFPPGSSTPKP